MRFLAPLALLAAGTLASPLFAADAGSAAGNQPVVDELPVDYVRRLERIEQAVSRARRLADSDPVAAAASAQQAHQLMAARVRVNGIAPHASDLEDALASAARASGRQVRSALEPVPAQLQQLRAEAHALARPDTAHDAKILATARRTVAEVMRRKEFQQAARGESLNERLMRWILNVMGGWLGKLSPGTVRSVAYVLLWCGGGALLLLLAYLACALAPYLGRHRRGTRTMDGVELAAAQPLALEALLAGAQDAQARGDYREALRLWFRAMLASLHRHQLIEFEESRTNGEYLSALGRAPAVRAALAPAAALFEQKLYGGAPTVLSDVDYFRAEFSELAGLLEARAREGAVAA